MLFPLERGERPPPVPTYFYAEAVSSWTPLSHPEDRMSPGENSVPPIAPEIRATRYLCPRSACDGFLYLRSDEHRHELRCPKCEFVIIIAADEKIVEPEFPDAKTQSAKVFSVWNLAALLIGMLIGFVLSRWFR